MNSRKTFAVAAAVTAPVAAATGALLEWLLDPDRGKSRRRQLADQTAQIHQALRAADIPLRAVTVEVSDRTAALHATAARS